MSDRIEVEGIEYPKPDNRQARRRTIFPVLPVRPRNMIWLVAVGAVFASVMLFGTPHLNRYTDLGPNMPDGMQYRFHRCDYIGWSPQVYIPNDGRCPIIKWLKAESEQ